jgi:hypothetical protein
VQELGYAWKSPFGRFIRANPSRSARFPSTHIPGITTPPGAAEAILFFDELYVRIAQCGEKGFNVFRLNLVGWSHVIQLIEWLVPVGSAIVAGKLA